MKRIAPLLLLLALTAASPPRDDRAPIIDPTIPPDMRGKQQAAARILFADPGVDGIATCKDNDEFYYKVWSHDKHIIHVDALDPYRVDWVVGPPIRAFNGPVLMGSSTNNDSVSCFTGTLGMVATDSAGTRGYITNSHVAAAGGRLGMCPGSGNKPVQFGPACSGNKIGVLKKNFTPLLTYGPTNYLDAAFVPSNTVDSHLKCGSTCPDSRIAPIILGRPVWKCGAGSPDLTRGRITCIRAQLKVRYACALFAYFEEQVEIEGNSFSGPGDSGSVVFGADGAVGLLFAGNGVSASFANPMQSVVNGLNVTLAQCP